ncbi:MAG: S8 family peptidase [Sciscionella sp.]
MPALRRIATAVMCATLAAGISAVVEPTASAAAATCSPTGSAARYLVVFDRGTPTRQAAEQITSACGSTTIYYPEIAVAVARSADADFAGRIGRHRVYSPLPPASNGITEGTAKPADPVDLSEGTHAATAADRTGAQWDMRMIGAPAAHRITEGSRNVVVGVLDSGIDRDQPELARALAPSLSAGCVSGAPDTAADAWTPSTSTHGTQVAGIIAAADDGKGITGVAPGVRLASVKVVNDRGYIYPAAVVCGLMWAARHHFTLTNNSYFVDPWLFTCANAMGQGVIYEAVRRAAGFARAQGVLNVAAAGNEGANLTDTDRDTTSPDNVAASARQDRALGPDCAVLPAGLRGVLTVSAVGAGRVKAGYSSYGLGAIAVTAPGGDQRSRCVLTTVPGGYSPACGTSIAAPHVTGVIALLASTHPHAGPSQLTSMLEAQARPVACPDNYDLSGTGAQDGYCAGYRAYNGFYGHGMVDALAAVLPGPRAHLDVR